MADYTAKLTNRNFHFWIKGNLALNIAKDGVRHIISNKIEAFHKAILQQVVGSVNGDLCNECQTENILPCPTSGFCTGRPCAFHCTQEKMFRPCPKLQCYKIKEKIRKSHRFNKPSWKNTRAELWSRNSWEIAKCYLPPDGYLGVKTIYETDINGILSIIANHLDFKSLFDDSTIDQVRTIGNSLRHSSDLCIEERTLASYIDILSSFLTSSKYLDSVVAEAIQNLEKLKSDELTLTTDDITKVITDVLRVNTEKILKDIKSALEQLRKTTGDNIEDILTAAASRIKRKATEDIGNAAKCIKHETVYQIEKAQSEAVGKVINEGKAVVASIKQQQSKAIETDPDKYEQHKKDLEEDLIRYYEHEHGSIPVSPLVPENDTSLLEFYVPARLMKVEVSVTGQGMKCETRETITSFEDIFQSGKNLCHNIYISAQAGIGKTTFSKRLCMVWCYAKKGLSPDSFKDKNILQSEIEMLRTFDVLFFILLRDVKGIHSHIDDMILDHLVPQLAGSHNYKLNFIKEVLHLEKCLIILDGLDEWSYPSAVRSTMEVPHRVIRKKCAILTTTRPWKMHEARISKSKIDKEIEMTALDHVSIQQLVKNVIYALPDIPDRNKLITDIFTRIANNGFEDITATPVLLIQLICLWHDGRTAGESKCQMYCNIVEFILHRGVTKIKELGGKSLLQGLRQKTAEEADYPPCFRNNEYCKKYFRFLLKVSSLAFTTLINDNKESALVLEMSKVREFLNKDELQLCLEIGLLTKSKRRRLSVSEFTVSFIHKGFQEFFCALYMLSFDEESNTLRVVSEFCHSVRKILDLSNVLIFLSGLHPNAVSILSKRLCDSATRDSLTKEYRSELCVFNKLNERNQPLKELQNMYVACVQESEYNGSDRIDIWLEDFVYDIDCKKENYRKGLQELIRINNDRIKSLFINTEGTTLKLRQVVNEFSLNRIHSLEKLSVVSEVVDHDFDDLLPHSLQSLKALSVKCVHWIGKTWTFGCVSLSESSINFLQSMPLLEGFELECANMTHNRLKGLLDYISNTKSLKQIGIGKLSCLDHTHTCEGFDLDLSEHDNLNFFEFGSMELKSFKINVLSLENCAIGRLSANILTSVLESLSKATKLRVFSCLNFTEYDDITEKVLQTLTLLDNLHVIYLQQVDLGDKTINLSTEMKNIECIELNRVRMSVSLVTKLVDIVSKLHHSVTIILRNCEIKEEADYVKLKDNITTSDKFVVLYDNVTELKYHLFSFKSII